MDAAIWGLLGTIVGALTSVGTTWITSRHAFYLQRQSASDEQRERSRAFQRETLIQLQEALSNSLRMMTRAHLEDVHSLRESGQLGYLSEEVNEGVRVTSRKVSILIQRVADDALRTDLKMLVGEMGRLGTAKTELEAEDNLVRTYQRADTVTQHLGAVLRGLY